MRAAHALKVRVYPNGSSPVVFPGGHNARGGIYVEVRAPQGSGATAIPRKIVNLNPSNVRKLPKGDEADFDYIGPFPGGPY